MEAEEYSGYFHGKDLIDSGEWDKGVAVLERAAASGDSHSCNYLAYLLMNPPDPCRRDPMKAKDLLLRGAKNGSAESAFQLGLLCLESNQIEPAISWFMSAAEVQHIPAAQRLGFIGRHCPGLSAGQIKDAFKYMQWAADNGHVFAMRDLAIVLLFGVHRKREVLKAIVLGFRAFFKLVKLTIFERGSELMR